MPRIPLEDNFTDVLGKAQRGLGLSDADLVAKAGITAAELAALKKGEIRDHPLRAIARALQLNGAALLKLARKEWYPEQPVFPSRSVSRRRSTRARIAARCSIRSEPRSSTCATFS